MQFVFTAADIREGKWAIHWPPNCVCAVKSISKAKPLADSDICDVQRKAACMKHVVGVPKIVSFR